MYCSEASLIYEPISCQVRTNFTFSSSMYLPNFPNTVIFSHSNLNETTVSLSYSTVDSQAKDVTFTKFFHYILPGTYVLTISAQKDNQLVKLSQTVIFTKTFTIYEINEIYWDNKVSFSSPIKIDTMISLNYSLRIYAKKDFLVNLGDDVDSQVVANYSSSEGSLINYGPKLDNMTLSNIQVAGNINNDTEFILLNSFFAERVFIKELSLIASTAGQVQFSVWKLTSCNDSGNCSKHLSDNPNNSTMFLRKFNFTVIFD